MSKNYYSEINLHVVWHTKANLPILTPEIEAATHFFLRERMIETPGVFVHDVGGTETHVHLCLTIPPTLTLSDYIGKLKGASSYEINHNNPTRDKLLQWQTGYGVVSFGSKDLEWVKAYVRNQKEHHAKGNVYDRLERITNEETTKAP